MLSLFSFFTTAQLNFGSEQVIAGQNGVVTVYSADFDGNGTIDLLSTSTQDGIRWWSNDGSGNFTEAQYLQQMGTQAQALAATINDFDDDGDLDVGAIINTVPGTSPTSIYYFENTGGGVFSNGQVLGSTGPSAQEIQSADLDSDGDTDLIYVDQADDELGWVPNLGGGNWDAAILINTASNGAQSVAAADFDGDTDIDIMVSGQFDDEWKWFANNGNEVFGAATVIGSGNNPSSVAVGDVDGDGDIDAVSVYAIDGDVIWAENNGSGFNAPEFLLDGPGFPDNFPITVELDDLDQDGDLDVIMCSILDNTINWFPNLGGGNFGAIEELISGAADVRQMAIGDFDGDGDLDIAAANFDADELAWYENLSGFQIPGCTDSNACNFDPLATNDNGSCDYSCFGCTDNTACNFDPAATIDDGSCDFNCLGCTDPNACNFDPLATLDDESCQLCDCFGCTDPAACNFNADALQDDGSCFIAPPGYDCNGECIDVNNDGICDFIIITGCTDDTALNYDPAAGEDDGSCIFGQNLCGAGTVWDPALEQCVSTATCPGDLNEDNIVTSSDLLIFLGVFGNPCP